MHAVAQRSADGSKHAATGRLRLRRRLRLLVGSGAGLALVAGLPPTSTASTEWASAPVTTVSGPTGRYSMLVATDGRTAAGSAATDTGRHALAYDLATGRKWDLGTLGGRASEARAVEGETVVGSADRPHGRRHAFAFDLRTETMRDLGTLGGWNSSAVDIDGGVIVGAAGTAEKVAHAFAYDLPTGTMRDLGTLGGPGSEAVDIDGSIVVGNSPAPDPANPGSYVSHAFAFDLDTGRMRDLGTLGGESRAEAVDGDTVVGWSYTGADPQRHAFAYDLSTDTMRDLGTFGGRDSVAHDVSGDTVVGWADLEGSAARHAFAYDLSTDTMRDLGTLHPGDSGSAAVAVEGDVVVGLSGRVTWTGWPDPAGSTGFLYRLGAGSMGALASVSGYDHAWPVAVGGGVVVGGVDELRYDDVSGEFYFYERRAAVWTQGVSFWEVVPRFAEDDGTVELVVRRGGDTSGPLEVAYTRVAGSATPGEDFTFDPGAFTFEPGESVKRIPLTIVDDDRPERRETIVVSLATPGRDVGVGSPTVTTVTIPASDQQLDASIAPRPDSGFRGEGVHNTTGTGQTVRRAQSPGDARSFYVRVTNDGNARNTFTLWGSRPVPDARIRYFSGTRDVTSAMRSRAGLNVTRAPGRSQRLRVWVKLRSTADVGSTKRALVTATWAGDSPRTDRVRAAVRVVR